MRSYKGTIYSHMPRIKKKRIRLLLNVLSQLKHLVDHLAHRNGLVAPKNLITSMRMIQTFQITPGPLKREKTAPPTSSSIVKVDLVRSLELWTSFYARFHPTFIFGLHALEMIHTAIPHIWCIGLNQFSLLWCFVTSSQILLETESTYQLMI